MKIQLCDCQYLERISFDYFDKLKQTNFSLNKGVTED
jgi:hypothetical protein